MLSIEKRSYDDWLMVSLSMIGSSSRRRLLRSSGHELWGGRISRTFESDSKVRMYAISRKGRRHDSMPARKGAVCVFYFDNCPTAAKLVVGLHIAPVNAGCVFTSAVKLPLVLGNNDNTQ